MTDDLIRQLMAAGLTKQQASSVTAETLVRLFMNEDGKILIKEAQKEHGEITDDRAKNIVALYGALLSMNARAGAEATDAVHNAGYVVYAYLGGQAKREITYATDSQ